MVKSYKQSYERYGVGEVKRAMVTEKLRHVTYLRGRKINKHSIIGIHVIVENMRVDVEWTCMWYLSMFMFGTCSEHLSLPITATKRTSLS